MSERDFHEESPRDLSLVTIRQSLEEVKGLPDEQWVVAVSQICPQLIEGNEVAEDIATLSDIAEAAKKMRKGEKIRYVFSTGAMGVIVSGVLVMVYSPVPVVGVFMMGGGILSPIASLPFIGSSYRLHEHVENWNNRGKNWLHQQRDRMFGDSNG